MLSDPVGDKVDFLAKAATKGDTVVMVFIGIDDAESTKSMSTDAQIKRRPASAPQYTARAPAGVMATGCVLLQAAAMV